jgi:putative membrane protein
VRVEHLLGAEARAAIERAVAEVEGKTSAEIVPVVARASANYSRAEDILGVWCGILGLLVLGLSHPDRQIDLFEGLVVFFVGLGLGAGFLSRFAPVKRLFTGRADREARVVEAASRLFFSQRIGRTAQRTGILLYVSLFERVAVVLGDGKTEEALGADGLARLRDRLVAGMKEGRPVEGFASAIREAGENLAIRLPRLPGDRNELPDRLVVLG